jgi:hypothetical protein
MKIGLFEIIFLPRAAAKNSLLMFPKNITKKKNSMTDFSGNCRLFDLIRCYECLLSFFRTYNECRWLWFVLSYARC